MVTAIQVFVSLTDGGVVDNGGAASPSVGVNKRQLSIYDDEDTKNRPTLKRHNYEPPSSVKSPNDSIIGGWPTIVTTATNNPHSSDGYYSSYAEIEAMCSSVDTTTDDTPNSVLMPPYSKIIAETTTASDYFEATTARRPQWGKNQAFEFQHTSLPRLMNNQQQQQPERLTVQFSARREEKKTASTPKRQKLYKMNPNNDATSKQEKEKSAAATLKKTLNAITPDTNGEAAQRHGYGSNYGQRGVTIRNSGKCQVQYYYCGKSRYIGVFESKMIALAAYETTREILGRQTPDGLTDAEVDSNIKSAREAVFDAIEQARNGGRLS